MIEVERKDDNWKIDVDRGTVYLASATIISLATFGSLVTVRVIGESQNPQTQNAGFRYDV